MTNLLDELAAILRRGGIPDTDTEAARLIQAAKLSAPTDPENTARTMAERRGR